MRTAAHPLVAARAGDGLVPPGITILHDDDECGESTLCVECPFTLAPSAHGPDFEVFVRVPVPSSTLLTWDSGAWERLLMRLGSIHPFAPGRWGLIARINGRARKSSRNLPLFPPTPAEEKLAETDLVYWREVGLPLPRVLLAPSAAAARGRRCRGR